MTRPHPAHRLPLAGLRVLELATVVAGPGAGRYLADFGADVVKVERPDGGDSARHLGLADPADGVSLYFKVLARNKRSCTLDLKSPADREVLLGLADDAHVLIENFRPGTLERLGIGPDVLLGRNPSLVITRVTGFGQDGPYASRAGFATLAEAMSGFAAVNGEPGGAPLLPPIALTDEVTALVAAFATMVALHSGVGQVVDVDLWTSLLTCMGPMPSAWATTGYLQPRLGSGIPYTVPRGTWCCSDGGWVAVSTSAESVAHRVMELLGLGERDDLRSAAGRMAARAEIDGHMARFCAARSRDEVLAAFEQASAAAAPVYDLSETMADPHVIARAMIEVLDGVAMPSVVARLSATPGALRWGARPLGADEARWA